MNRRELIRLVGVGTVGLAAGCVEDFAPSTSPDTAADGANPWAQESLTVGLTQEVPARQEFLGLVQDALDYWEENVETFAN